MRLPVPGGPNADLLRESGRLPGPGRAARSSSVTKGAPGSPHVGSGAEGDGWSHRRSGRVDGVDSGGATPTVSDVTQLLAQWRDGDARAFDELVPLVYAELRQLADHYLQHERNGHTLQPTALVHEAYLRLARQSGAGFNNRVHFYGAAATVMRRILVDHARRRLAREAGGGSGADRAERCPRGRHRPSSRFHRPRRSADPASPPTHRRRRGSWNCATSAVSPSTKRRRCWAWLP